MLLAPGAHSAFDQDNGLMRLANMELKQRFWADAVPPGYEDPFSHAYYLRELHAQILPMLGGGIVPDDFLSASREPLVALTIQNLGWSL